MSGLIPAQYGDDEYGTVETERQRAKVDVGENRGG
jgi:hypothetical protein